MGRRQFISSGIPAIPGKSRRHIQGRGRGIGAERPKKASPETLNPIGSRVLKLVGIKEIPKEEGAESRNGRVLKDGRAVLLVVQNQSPEFAIQIADTDNDTTTLHQWSKNAAIQRVTEVHSGAVRARLAPEDTGNMDATLKVWEAEAQTNGEA